MLDENWEMINGPEAHEIEVLNYTNQINVIEGLSRFLFHHGGVDTTGCKIAPNENALKELHRTGTLFLLQNPGTYRKSDVHVAKADGTVVYNPPPWADVGRHMTEFFSELQAIWNSDDPLEVAAFALWKINWVHPFKNGNGRTARAFAYTCLGLKFGFLLPGTPTVLDQIMVTRDQYNDALRAADAAHHVGGRDISVVKQYLESLLSVQFQAVGT